MSNPSSLPLRQNQAQRQTLKQAQRLMMLPQMQQALALLQMPVMELAAVMETELEQNPVLDTGEDDERQPGEETESQDTPLTALAEKEVSFDEQNFEILKYLDEEYRDHFSQDDMTVQPRTAADDRKQTFLESLISRPESLGEHLMQQARESFEESEDLAAAEWIIGYLDANGLLTTPLSEIAQLHNLSVSLLQGVLHEIQTFDPPGIGAISLQESLLAQLRAHGSEHTLAYSMIEDYWDDLLHHRIPAIAKGLGCDTGQVANAINEVIVKLDLHPATAFSSQAAQPIVPDVIIKLDEEKLSVLINDDPLPSFRLNRRYLRMLDDPTTSEEVRDFIRQKLTSAKWLHKTVDQRYDTLFRLAESLIKTQADFFLSAEGKLHPLTMKSVAEELGVHESTIARAVANKYMDSPRGILPLRSFFTNAYVTEQGQDISSRTVRDALETLITKENKTKPFSDDALSRLLKAQGIPCARRTVAKYRSELQIGNALQRRLY